MPEQPDEIKAQLQAAQDMLDAAINQRNHHENECVQLAAQLRAAARKIAELEAKLKGAAEPELPLRNGHAPEIETEIEARAS